MTIELIGNWKKGFTYDIHTLDSVYLGTDEQGHEQYKTTCSEMGELLYRLKYQGDASMINPIMELLKRYKGIETMDCIIPIPASKSRRVQPVLQIALALGKGTDVPVMKDVLKRHMGEQALKDTKGQEERMDRLRAQFHI